MWCVLQTRQNFFKPYGLQAFITDFLLQCCTILCATTVYADSPQTLTGLLLLPAIAAYLQPRTDSANANDDAIAQADGKVTRGSLRLFAALLLEALALETPAPANSFADNQ